MKHVLSAVVIAIAGRMLLPPVQAASPDLQRTRELLAVVRSETELAARARALQQLALVATRDAVPPAAALLGDEKLGQYARDVLEQMPDPAAGDALRAAIDRLKGDALIGVVNSLGVRRDRRAVEPLSRLAREGAPAVAVPALLALGRIGTSDALRVLESALTRDSAERRAAAAEACLMVAERQAREGGTEAALALYERIRSAELPLPLRVSATRGAIAVAGNRGLALLIDQLHSPEAAMRDVALLAIRDLRHPQVTPRLVQELAQLSPNWQALVIAALADRGEQGALAAIESRAKTGNEEVRVAAVDALARIGRASSLPILLQAMSDASTPVATAARASLVQIPAPDTNAFVRRALSGADAALQVKLIGVLGERQADEARAELMTRAGGRDLEVSKAAFRALGLIARPGDMSRLIQLAIAASDEGAKSLADRALVTTSMKVLQPERRADAVLEAFRGETDPGSKAALVRPLRAIVRSMGSSHEVFFALRAALQDEEAPAVRAAALHALADWPDATPTMLLLDVATDENVSPAERDGALAGAIRMAADVAAGRERSPLNVVEAFTRANRAVRTDAEKLMIVSGLGELRRPESALMLQPYLNEPSVRTEAAMAVVKIAPALIGGKNARPVQPMLEKIAATEEDERVRRKAAQLAQGGPLPAAKEKKGRKAVAAARADAGPQLFNGRDLGDWDGDPAVWRVRDGIIVGGSLDGNPRNEFLATTKRYRNFVLRLDYKLVGTEGFVNGGVQFRSVRIPQPPNEMMGYQADIGAGHSGSLYDESRRKTFLARAGEGQIKQLEKEGDWNHYEIRCDGDTVELSLNGRKTVTFTESDPNVKPEGLIALQIHGNCKAEIAFRNLVITELP